MHTCKTSQLAPLPPGEARSLQKCQRYARRLIPASTNWYFSVPPHTHQKGTHVRVLHTNQENDGDGGGGGGEQVGDEVAYQ